MYEFRCVSSAIPLGGTEKSRFRPSMKAFVYLPCCLSRRCRAVSLQRDFRDLAARAASRDHLTDTPDLPKPGATYSRS
jgi:hypothetical protein